MVCSFVLLCGMGGYQRCLIGTRCGSSLGSLLGLVGIYLGAGLDGGVSPEPQNIPSAQVPELGLFVLTGVPQMLLESGAVFQLSLSPAWGAVRCSLPCQQPAWNGGGSAAADTVCSWLRRWDSFQLAFNDVKMSGSSSEHLCYEYISSLYLIFPSSEMNEFQEG